MTCSAIASLYADNKTIWIITNRKVLPKQWLTELGKFAPNTLPAHRHVGFIWSGHTYYPDKRIQIVQCQTLKAKKRSTGKTRLDAIPGERLPDIIVCDEAHESAFDRIVNSLVDRCRKEREGVVQINLTATPARHGKNHVQYADFYPKATWYEAATLKQLVRDGQAKKPVWIPTSEKLAAITERRFAGMKEIGGDFDETSQAAVMVDLIPNHLEEWEKLGGADRTGIWFCVTVNHAELVTKALKEKGYDAHLFVGDTTDSDRANILELAKCDKNVQLVGVGCFTTGFDLPVVSSAVFLRRTLSVGLFVQMAGRALRKYPNLTDALMFDLAGNLSCHPFPEDIDWFDYDPCQRLFRDPKMVLCSHCGYRHEGIPTPKYTGKVALMGSGGSKGKITFKIKLCAFMSKTKDKGDQLKGEVTSEIQPRELEFYESVPVDTLLYCHGCDKPVYGHLETLIAYGNWLDEVSAARQSGSGRLPLYKGTEAGIYIGSMPQGTLETQHLTIADLYDSGVWELSLEEGGGNGGREDRSEEYRKLRQKLIKRLKGKELREYKLSLLSPQQQAYIDTCSVSVLSKIPDPATRYRAAVAAAYLDGKSPTWAFRFWQGDSVGARSLVSQALRIIASNNPDQTYPLLRSWLESCIAESDNQKVKGVCNQFLKSLAALMPSDTPE